MNYYYKAKCRIPFRSIIEELSSELMKEGFVVLSSSDLQQLFRQKLNRDIKNYTVMTALIPELANELLMKEPFTGMMLPCVITVQEYDTNEVEITAVNPSEWIAPAIHNPGVLKIAQQISRRLSLAITLSSKKENGFVLH